MKRFFVLSIAALFVIGILFPVSRTSEKGKSSLFEQIKKVFHFSDGLSGKEGTKRTGKPVLHGEGGSDMFQKIGEAFHYFPEDTKRSKTKKYPPKFDKALQKQLRYPSEKETTK